MAETVQFRGAVLRQFSSPPQGETSPFVRSYWTVDFADPSNSVMGWKDPSECGVTGANLEGDIAAANVIVTPHDPQLACHELQFDCHEAADFKLHTVSEDGSTRREVRFIIRSNVEGVAAMLEAYRWRVGDKPAMLKLSYVKQETLDLGQDDKQPLQKSAVKEARAAHGPVSDTERLSIFGAPDGPCVSCCNEIPFEDPPRNSTHVTGQKCARAVENATLASAVTTGAGTHQRKRGRKRLDIPEETAGDGVTEIEDEPVVTHAQRKPHGRRLSTALSGH